MNSGHYHQIEEMSLALEKMERDVFWQDPHISQASQRIIPLAKAALDALAEQLREDLDNID